MLEVHGVPAFHICRGRIVTRFHREQEPDDTFSLRLRVTSKALGASGQDDTKIGVRWVIPTMSSPTQGEPEKPRTPRTGASFLIASDE
jgi:hypothetical protein